MVSHVSVTKEQDWAIRHGSFLQRKQEREILTRTQFGASWINHIAESFHNTLQCCVWDIELFQKAPFGALVPINGSHPGGVEWNHGAFHAPRVLDVLLER